MGNLLKNRYLSAGTLGIGILALTIAACSENEKDIVKAMSITDVVSKNPELSILNRMIQYSGMSDSLSTGTFTLFAPDNAAFEKINLRNASAISTVSKDSVKKFLKLHLLTKKMSYSQFTAGSLTNIGKGKLLVTKDGDQVLINLNRVEIRDVNASNGLIQVIDSVLVKFK
jgi:uncharacterized surface protein with fasciclin (FAS1) repeats